MVKRRCRRHRPGLRESGPVFVPGRRQHDGWRDGKPKVLKEAPTLELVLKRNPVERMKREKSPLSMMGELPALIATGYADIEEEDLVRLKWWGLYHDKPKIGHLHAADQAARGPDHARAAAHGR